MDRNSKHLFSLWFSERKNIFNRCFALTHHSKSIGWKISSDSNYSSSFDRKAQKALDM